VPCGNTTSPNCTSTTFHDQPGTSTDDHAGYHSSYDANTPSTTTCDTRKANTQKASQAQAAAQRNGVNKDNGQNGGPCHFGCSRTWTKPDGVPLWKKVPHPSPWLGVPVGRIVCKKCYESGVNLRRNHGIAQIPERSDRRPPDCGTTAVAVPPLRNKRTRVGTGHDPPAAPCMPNSPQPYPR
jgi:hypothetical protein